MASPSPSLSLTDKLGAQLTLIKALLSSYVGALTYPITPRSVKQPSIQQERTRKLFRAVLAGLSPLQIQHVNPPGTQTYHDWLAANAKADGIPIEPYTQDLVDGGKLHWIGKKSATKVILHFHSGGYALPLIPGHISFINYLRKEVQHRASVDVKIAFLEYTLIPHATYPTQFRQAVSALQTVINGGISPSDIVVSGDSAGGQLVLQLLGHVLHPHPSIQELTIPSETPLGGFLLLGAWTSFSVKTPSWKSNLKKDMLDAAAITLWANSVRASTLLDAKNDYAEDSGWWLEPSKAPAEWWKGTERVTKHILFCWGEHEVLKDGIAECRTKMKESLEGSGVEIKEVEEPRGMHIGPVFDAATGRKPAQAAEIMAKWTNERLCR